MVTDYFITASNMNKDWNYLLYNNNNKDLYLYTNNFSNYLYFYFKKLYILCKR